MKGHSADIPGSPRDASSSTTHALVNVLHAVLEPGSHQHITDYINRNGPAGQPVFPSLSQVCNRTVPGTTFFLVFCPYEYSYELVP